MRVGFHARHSAARPPMAIVWYDSAMVRKRKRLIVIAALVAAVLVASWLLQKPNGRDPLFAYLAKHTTICRVARGLFTITGQQQAFDERILQAQLWPMRIQSRHSWSNATLVPDVSPE
jgi:hypothetical protein